MISHAVGQPNVNDATAGAWRASTSILASYSSSVWRGSPSSTPSQSASGASSAMNSSTGSRGWPAAGRANTFTPNGRSVSVRVASISASIASAVL